MEAAQYRFHSHSIGKNLLIGPHILQGEAGKRSLQVESQKPLPKTL